MKPLWIVFNDNAYTSIFNRHFSPSWWSHNAPDFDIIAHPVAERFGDFGAQEFNENFRRQMHQLHRDVAENIGREIVWSDTDLRFYGPVLDDLRATKAATGADILTSKDGDTHCTGFQYFRATYKVLRFIEDWLDLAYSKQWEHEQVSFNALINEQKLDHTKARVAGLGQRYWNLGFVQGPDVKFPWEAGGYLPAPPKDILVHHGNYTKGIPNKLALLDAVQALVEGPTQAAA